MKNEWDQIANQASTIQSTKNAVLNPILFELLKKYVRAQSYLIMVADGVNLLMPRKKWVLRFGLLTMLMKWLHKRNINFTHPLFSPRPNLKNNFPD